MGFFLQGLAPPDLRYSSRSLASHAIPRPHRNRSCKRDRRDFRGLSKIGEGNGEPALRLDRTESTNLALLGVCPSKAFSSIALRPP